MTTIVIPCPKCGHHLHLPDRAFLGRKGRCPDCQLKFVMEAELVIDEEEARRVEAERAEAEAEARAAEEQRLAEERRQREEQRRREEKQRQDEELRRQQEQRQAEKEQQAKPKGEAVRYADTLSAGEPVSAAETVEPPHSQFEQGAFLAETELNPMAANGGEPPGETVDFDESKAAALAAMVDDDDEIPEQFGRYRVLELIGQGSMGAVYLAHDSELDRKIALKIPRFSDPYSTEEPERFYREARAAATLRHPNICQVFDIGEIEGRHFIAMEYISGNPLSAFIKQPKLQPVRKIAATVRKLAKALHEAHENGLVHRDLKPDNIMIDERGEPIIMDFGLVRVIDDDDRITSSGAIVGSPAYMSPEQVGGTTDDVGPPSDIFSLGIITYELLTRRRPFRGSLSTIFEQISSVDPLPPSKLRPDLDPVFESICLTMMAKRVADRYPSMAKLAEAISFYLKDSSTSSVSGQSVISMSESAQATRTATNADEVAALWILEIGGTLKISNEQAKSITVPDIDSLPQTPFQVVDVALHKNGAVNDDALRCLRGLKNLHVLRLSETGITDAGLEHLSGLTGLPVLDLSYTKVTDAGLRQLKGLKGLKQLDLANTQITDAGLAHIKRLSGLQFLGLYATSVTDAGLKTLSGLKNLQFLGLYGTKVTDAGVTKLKKSLRNCTISR